MAKPRCIPTKVRFRIWAMPCTICKRPDDIEVDHIVAVSDGGGSEESNLQPLCRVCNVLKRYHKTNDAVIAWIYANPHKHAARQKWRTERRALMLKGEWF